MTILRSSTRDVPSTHQRLDLLLLPCDSGMGKPPESISSDLLLGCQQTGEPADYALAKWGRIYDVLFEGKTRSSSGSEGLFVPAHLEGNWKRKKRAIRLVSDRIRQDSRTAVIIDAGSISRPSALQTNRQPEDAYVMWPGWWFPWRRISCDGALDFTGVQCPQTLTNSDIWRAKRSTYCSSRVRTAPFQSVRAREAARPK